MGAAPAPAAAPSSAKAGGEATPAGAAGVAANAGAVMSLEARVGKVLGLLRLTPTVLRNDYIDDEFYYENDGGASQEATNRPRIPLQE